MHGSAASISRVELEGLLTCCLGARQDKDVVISPGTKAGTTWVCPTLVWVLSSTRVSVYKTRVGVSNFHVGVPDARVGCFLLARHETALLSGWQDKDVVISPGTKAGTTWMLFYAHQVFPSPIRRPAKTPHFVRSVPPSSMAVGNVLLPCTGGVIIGWGVITCGCYWLLSASQPTPANNSCYGYTSSYVYPQPTGVGSGQCHVALHWLRGCLAVHPRRRRDRLLPVSLSDQCATH